jgi:hypothetical protein
VELRQAMEMIGGKPTKTVDQHGLLDLAPGETGTLFFKFLSTDWF